MMQTPAETGSAMNHRSKSVTPRYDKPNANPTPNTVQANRMIAALDVPLIFISSLQQSWISSASDHFLS